MAERKQLIEMVCALQRGEKDSAVVLYEAYFRDLQYYILKRVNDPKKAKILTQETFVEIIEKIHLLEDSAAFVEWSREIAEYKCVSYKEMRKGLLQNKVGAITVNSIAEEREDIHVKINEGTDVSRSQIQEMMESLSEEQRKAILTSYAEERTSDRERTNVSLNGIKVLGKVIESFLRKVIVGIAATAILAAISDVGMDWTYKSDDETVEGTGIFEGTQGDKAEISVAETKIEGEETEQTEEETETVMAIPTEPIKTEPIQTTPIEPESSEVTDAEIGSNVLEYILVDDYYVVTGMAVYADENLIIPAEYNGLPVREVSDQAFLECEDLRSVTIPDSVTIIGDEAFGSCRGITEIHLPKGLVSIGEYAFSYCLRLNSITIPTQVSHIPNTAFFRCDNLEYITVEEGNSVYHSTGNCLIETAIKKVIIGCKNSVIPTDGSVTIIGSDSFAQSEITEISIPEGVTTIGSYAFYASGLERVQLPSSITMIDYKAFHICTDLRDIYYAGTVREWNFLYKGIEWDYVIGEYTVHCADGDIVRKN